MTKLQSRNFPTDSLKVVLEEILRIDIIPTSKTSLFKPPLSDDPFQHKQKIS